VPPPLVYAAGFLAGVGLESVAASPTPPKALRVAAGAWSLAVLGALDTTATVRFVRSRTPIIPVRPAKRLVTDGPYRFTRNPMYLGMAGAYAGAAVATGVLWALPFLPAVVSVIDRQVIPREERHLAESFGDEYEDYRRKVRRWL
jgi:protein-S-isoprenylcysteine O-methyltransferase Ste14